MAQTFGSDKTSTECRGDKTVVNEVKKNCVTVSGSAQYR